VPSQYAVSRGSNGTAVSRGEQYRAKYHDDSTNVSIVSVSRRAGPPHRGQRVSTNAACVASGEPPVPVITTSSGSTTGSSRSGTGTVPQRSQYTTGMGAPQ